MTQINADKIIAKINSFPSMPATGSKLLRMLEDPEPSVDEIENVLRLDPGLTGNVLKLANSAYFGLPSKVATTRQAVLLLGKSKLIQLVITSCVNAVMEKPVPGYNLPPGDLWRHSIAVSIAAQALVKEKNFVQEEDIFTPALLHDIGKLVLGHFVKDERAEIEKIAGNGLSYVAAENKVLGTDHAAVGAEILTQWAFPRDVVEVVRWHHDPDHSEADGAAIDIVYLADLLCQTADSDRTDEHHCPDLSPAVIKRLGLEINQFEKIKASVAQWVDELSEALTFN